MNQYPLVYLDHVTKNYGHEVALMDVSLNIQPGHIIGLLGPNGSGKTTIIKLINGLLQPSLGNIYIFMGNYHPQLLKSGFLFARSQLI